MKIILAGAMFLLMAGCATTQQSAEAFASGSPPTESAACDSACLQKKECENGSARTCYKAGMLALENGNLDGIDLLAKACNRGEGRACTEYLKQEKNQERQRYEQNMEQQQQLQTTQNGTSQEYDESYNAAILGQYQPGKCYDSTIFGYVVVNKIDKRHYGLVGQQSGKQAILETSRNINDTGWLNLQIKTAGKTTAQTQNGFTRVVDKWKECK